MTFDGNQRSKPEGLLHTDTNLPPYTPRPPTPSQVGSALSPNGLALSGEGMMGMALLDKVLSVDKEKMQVIGGGGRAGEGTRVSEVRQE